MNNKLTQEITNAIHVYSLNSLNKVASLTELVILILEQAKSDAQEAIEARMAGHLYASHHDVEIDNGRQKP